MKQKMIAGQEINLEAGQRYRASRPMATRKAETLFPVTITALADGSTKLTIDLDYDEANKVINAFNNGLVSLQGRIW